MVGIVIVAVLIVGVLLLIARRRRKRATSADALTDALGLVVGLPKWRHRPYRGRWWL